MNWRDRVNVFSDTMEYSLKGFYYLNSKKIRINPPNQSKVYNSLIDIKEIDYNKNRKIEVVNEDVLLTALKIKEEKPAILNMASGFNPGGGVERGAGSQEEYLCRCSSYYLSLSKCRPFYPLEKDFGGIYTENVTVFRGPEEEEYPLLEEPFLVNMIAVPAISNPVLQNGKLSPVDKIRTINKIKTIFNIALDNNQKVLILGAFGCGVFNNPPLVMAQLFLDVLNMPIYKNAFKLIIFAIKEDSNSPKGGNYKPFKIVLS